VFLIILDDIFHVLILPEKDVFAGVFCFFLKIYKELWVKSELQLQEKLHRDIGLSARELRQPRNFQRIYPGAVFQCQTMPYDDDAL